MIRLLWAISALTAYYLRRYVPSNIVLDLIRRRRGLRWGIPAMLLAVPYLLIAVTAHGMVEDGGHGWWNLVVLWACWCALKFILMGPLSVILLIRARLREWKVRRDARRYGYDAGAAALSRSSSPLTWPVKAR